MNLYSMILEGYLKRQSKYKRRDIILKNKKNTKFNTFFFIFILCQASVSSAETIPIPPKRPAVMSVSQAYINSLIQRDTVPVTEDDQSTEILNDISPSAPAGEGDFIFDDDGGFSEIEDINAQELLLSIENSLIEDTEIESKISNSIIDEFIPIPIHKPLKLASLTKSYSKKANDEKALISFMLEPDQIDLDNSLKEFLVDYAIGMFRSNQDLMMEIYAYATLEDNKDYSDVRRSLARALEVRRFLLSHNIQASRLKIIPVGLDDKNKADDRIDLLFVSQQ